MTEYKVLKRKIERSNPLLKGVAKDMNNALSFSVAIHAISACLYALLGILSLAVLIKSIHMSEMIFGLHWIIVGFSCVGFIANFFQFFDSNQHVLPETIVEEHDYIEIPSKRSTK